METDRINILNSAINADLITLDEIEGLLRRHLAVEVKGIERWFNNEEDFVAFDVDYLHKNNNGALGIIFNSSDVFVGDVFSSAALFKNPTALVDDYLELLDRKTKTQEDGLSGASAQKS